MGARHSTKRGFPVLRGPLGRECHDRDQGGIWMGTPIAAADLTWLLMDRRNNLMHVHGLLTLESTPEWDFERDFGS